MMSSVSKEFGVGDVRWGNARRGANCQFLGRCGGPGAGPQPGEGTFAVAGGGFYDQCGQR